MSQCWIIQCCLSERKSHLRPSTVVSDDLLYHYRATAAHNDGSLCFVRRVTGANTSRFSRDVRRGQPGWERFASHRNRHTHTAEALITMMMTMMMKMMAMTTEMIKTNVTDWRIEMLPLSRSAALQPMRKNPASETSDASFQTPIYAQCVDDFMVVNMSGLASDSAATSCCRCLTNLIIENFFPVAAPDSSVRRISQRGVGLHSAKK